MNNSSTCEIVKKTKIVKKVKYNIIGYFEREHIHITFYYSVLLWLFYFILINLLPCLIYKLNFTVGMEV